MKVDVEELSSVQRRMTVEIPAAEVDHNLDDMFKRLQRTARLKGFRPGKVPRGVLEKYYGPRVTADTAEILIQTAFPLALEQASLEPVAQPEIDFEAPKQGQDFVFKVTLDVRPVFELDSALYKGLNLKEPILEVSDEELGQRLDSLRERQAMLVPVEEPRPVEIGDVVVVDYQSFVEDKPVDGGAAENVELELGKGQVQEEIEVALVKAKVGDEVQAKVQYGPEAANPVTRDKEVLFKIAVKGIKKKVLPELDDDFARAVSPDFPTLEALKERLRRDLEEMFTQQKDVALRNQILDQIRELGQFDLPGSLVKAEVQDMINDYMNRLRQSGLNPDDLGLDQEKLAEEFRPQAERKVRAGIVLGHISEQEKVDVTEQDVDAEVELMAQRTGQPVQVLKEFYIKNNMISSMRARVLEEKTLQAIKADAIIVKVDPAELAKDTEKNSTQPESADK